MRGETAPNLSPAPTSQGFFLGRLHFKGVLWWAGGLSMEEWGGCRSSERIRTFQQL